MLSLVGVLLAALSVLLTRPLMGALTARRFLSTRCFLIADLVNGIWAVVYQDTNKKTMDFSLCTLHFKLILYVQAFAK